MGEDDLGKLERIGRELAESWTPHRDELRIGFRLMAGQLVEDLLGEGIFVLISSIIGAALAPDGASKLPAALHAVGYSAAAVVAWQAIRAAWRAPKIRLRELNAELDMLRKEYFGRVVNELEQAEKGCSWSYGDRSFLGCLQHLGKELSDGISTRDFEARFLVRCYKVDTNENMETRKERFAKFQTAIYHLRLVEDNPISEFERHVRLTAQARCFCTHYLGVKL